MPHSPFMADLLGIDRRKDKNNPSYHAIKMGNIPSEIAEKAHIKSILDNEKHIYNYECDRVFNTSTEELKQPARLKKLLGTLEHKEKGVLTKESSSMYDRSRYKFLLDAPFNISSMCCNVMKKKPVKQYGKQSGRKPITAQMASESKMRTQKWLQNGCNGFDMKSPISNPMAFWTEQDVLLYIKENNLPIASVYRDIVRDYKAMGELDGQMNMSDFGIFDKEMPLLKTTGCDRTGCAFCGYGCHLEKPEESRWQIAKVVSNPNIVDFCMRGGAFDENGLWKPNEVGLGYWFVMKWMNIHGNMKYYIPDYEKYEREYGTEETKKHLGINPN